MGRDKDNDNVNDETFINDKGAGLFEVEDPTNIA